SASAGRQTLRDVEEHTATNIGASWVHTFGPSSVLQMQYGRVVMEDGARHRFTGQTTDFGQQIGFSNQFAGTFRTVSTLTPALNVPDYFSGGELDQLFQPSNIHEGK